MPPIRWYYLIWLYLGVAAMPLLTGNDGASGDPAIVTKLTVAASAWVFLTMMVFAGAIRRNRRNRVDLAFERLQLLESQQETERRLAASEERTRIAREVHDVLGHSLNVIAIQAEGIRSLVKADPDRADAALAAVAELSRSAVDEVRSVVDLLRDPDESAPLQPAQRITELATLIESHRTAGANIAFHMEAELENCPDATGFAVYRIVQEALTNAIKHSPGAAILVKIDDRREQIEVNVLNTRGGAAPFQAAEPEHSGHGITGMKERAHALGGHLEAAPDDSTGGWKVFARIPKNPGR